MSQICNNLPHKIHKGKPCARERYNMICTELNNPKNLRLNEQLAHLRTDARQSLSEKPIKTVSNPAVGKLEINFWGKI